MTRRELGRALPVDAAGHTIDPDCVCCLGGGMVCCLRCPEPRQRAARDGCPRGCHGPGSICDTCHENADDEGEHAMTRAQNRKEAAADAVRAVFPPEAAEAITADEAFGALAFRLDEARREEGHDPAAVLAGISVSDRAFAAEADQPAAFLAARVRDGAYTVAPAPAAVAAPAVRPVDVTMSEPKPWTVLPPMVQLPAVRLGERASADQPLPDLAVQDGALTGTSTCASCGTAAVLRLSPVQAWEAARFLASYAVALDPSLAE